MEGPITDKSKITNRQYVEFLNKNIDKISIQETSVYLDGQLIVKINEKIRGYKPIVFENGRFQVMEAMHSACAVLMVTGAGAARLTPNTTTCGCPGPRSGTIS